LIFPPLRRSGDTKNAPAMERLITGMLGVGLMAAALLATSCGRDPHGNAANGRAIFNGKGFCLSCHGKDAYINQRPQQPPEIDRMIKDLARPPANFRKPSTLQAKTPDVLFRDIKEGHLGSAMTPKTFLTDQEIADLAAYLLEVREEVERAEKVHQP